MSYTDKIDSGLRTSNLRVLFKNKIECLNLYNRSPNIRKFFEYFINGIITVKKLESNSSHHDELKKSKEEDFLKEINLWSTYGDMFKVYFHLEADDKYYLVIKVSEHHPFLDGSRVRWKCTFNITNLGNFAKEVDLDRYIMSNLNDLFHKKYEEHLKQKELKWKEEFYKNELFSVRS